MPGPLQALLSIVGRLMLCTIFAMSAIGNKIPNFDGVVAYMDKAGVPQPKIMLAGAIVFLLVGSLSIIVGFKARFGACLLFIFLVLATYYFHDFWTLEDAQAKQNEMINFMKNLALMGAMVLIIANGPGAGSVDNLGCCDSDDAPSE